MGLAFPVVVDADKQDVVAVWCHLVRVLLPLDLADGRIGILVTFQFHHDGRRLYVFAWNQHQVGKTFPIECLSFGLQRYAIVFYSERNYGKLFKISSL